MGILRDFAENIRIAVRPEGIQLLDSVRRHAAIDGRQDELAAQALMVRSSV